ncbi:MAG TPA: substrate-binding domain-containing protein [Steroidobacteraceae bacterium]|jgi:ABC-type molybdate transport system substrate-binding protein|nr:substrate-binding domain-containing protein [Steroidobacteraceae bacterium]
MDQKRTITRVLTALGLGAFMNSGAAAQTPAVQIFAAGSLRGVVNDLAAQAGTALGIEVKSSFGGSGSMRERIEKGEPADLLMSADLGSPQKLEARGRTVVPTIAFARNRMCIVSRKADGMTAANLIDRLLAPGVRVKSSTPIVDPSGDYAWSIYKRIEALRPGVEGVLEKKWEATSKLVAKPATPTQSAAAALFATHAIDMSITYCSGTAALEREVPDLTSLVVPPNLDPHPVYGVAVLSARPEVLRLALFVLSEKGQAIIAKEGLVPLTEPSGSAQ